MAESKQFMANFLSVFHIDSFVIYGKFKSFRLQMVEIEQFHQWGIFISTENLYVLYVHLVVGVIETHIYYMLF